MTGIHVAGAKAQEGLVKRSLPMQNEKKAGNDDTDGESYLGDKLDGNRELCDSPVDEHHLHSWHCPECGVYFKANISVALEDTFLCHRCWIREIIEEFQDPKTPTP